jgi:uncharacterized Zn-binding protein involved in type VI secretion
MGKPAAKQGDQIVGTDIHIVMIPTPGGPVPTPLPHPFSGQLDNSLSNDVKIEGKPAAVQGSKASNLPPHIPAGGTFQQPPKDQAEVLTGSTTVFINGKPAARTGDPALTCNDPADLPAGQVIAVSTVLVGG